MIVKVKGENQDWVLFDNALQVRYNTTALKITSEAQLSVFEKPVESHELVTIFKDTDITTVSTNSPLIVGKLTFTANNRDYTVLFNTVAYLCNDSGKTVEKVAVNG